MPLDLEKLRRLIGDRSVAEVARAAGMAPPNLFRIISGKFDPKLSTVERIAAALGRKVKDLLA